MIAVYGCPAPRSSAAPAMLIWDTCSTTAPLPQVCVTASTRRPSSSKRNLHTARIPAARKGNLTERVVAESPRPACCKVGLDRPLIPTVFVANLLRSARVSRPCRSADRTSPGDTPTVGDRESVGRRGRAGLPTPARTSYRQRLFVEHYLGESSGSAVDATRRAGYQWPEKLGPRLVEKRGPPS